MKALIFIFGLLPSLCLAQNSTVLQSWNELGFGYKIDKRQSIGVDLTTRFDAAGLQTIFPQVSYKYKVNKYFRPSLDYRLIGTRDDYRNYTLQHRLNLNLQFAYSLNRFDLGFRTRYQFSANRSLTDLGSEFNDAFRFKPSIGYNMKNSNLSPNFGMEFFCVPQNGQAGYHLNRIRWNAGVAINLKDAGELEIGYLYDQRINSPGAYNKAILNLGYNYILVKKVKKGTPGRLL